MAGFFSFSIKKKTPYISRVCKLSFKYKTLCFAVIHALKTGTLAKGAVKSSTALLPAWTKRTTVRNPSFSPWPHQEEAHRVTPPRFVQALPRAYPELGHGPQVSSWAGLHVSQKARYPPAQATCTELREDSNVLFQLFSYFSQPWPNETHAPIPSMPFISWATLKTALAS